MAGISDDDALEMIEIIEMQEIANIVFMLSAPLSEVIVLARITAFFGTGGSSLVVAAAALRA